MCLAFPGKIVRLEGLNAVVEFHNVQRDIRVDLVPDCRIGDHVLVHAGFAINKLDEDGARETMETWEELIGILEKEGASPSGDQSPE